MSDSMSCVSCDFLQVQNFNPSSTPSSLSNGVSEDEEHDGSPNPRYIIRCFSKVRLWGCKIYYVISSNILINDALCYTLRSVLVEPIFPRLFFFIVEYRARLTFSWKIWIPNFTQFHEILHNNCFLFQLRNIVEVHDSFFHENMSWDVEIISSPASGWQVFKFYFIKNPNIWSFQL